MKERPEPRCLGRHWLFESISVSDHKEARKVCEGIGDEGRCPMYTACRAAVSDLQGTQWRSGVHGTWAGKLYGNMGRRTPTMEPA